MPKKLSAVFADGAYKGKFETKVRARFGIDPVLKISDVKRRDEIGRITGKLLNSNLKPTRWIVEQTLAWLNHYRRLSRDYEKCVSSSEPTIYLAMTELMLGRLAPNPALNGWP